MSNALFGCQNSDGSFQEGYIDSNGKMCFSDVKEKFFPCIFVEKYSRDKWFGGRKYYVILRIPELSPSVFELRSDLEKYSCAEHISSVKMYSTNGHTWFFDKNNLSI